MNTPVRVLAARDVPCAGKPLRVLLVEDSEDDAKLALRALRRGGFEPTHRLVQTAAELEGALAQERWDAVISDFRMPGFSGIDALRIFRSTGLDIPFILISGTIGESTAVDAMKAGASDYIMKESLARLAPALERELKEVRMRATHRHDLRHSESLKGAILESSLDCVVTIDHEGKIVEFNPAAEATFGLTREKAFGRDMVELMVPPRLREAHRRGFAHFLATGEGPILGKRLELEAIRADGTEFPIELAITALTTTSAPMFTAFIRDVTERKKADKRIKRLNRVYAVLSGINTLIVRVSDRDELFREACRIAVEQGLFRIAWIGIPDRDAMKIVPIASTGADADFLAVIKDRFSLREDAPTGNTLTARAIREKKVMVSNEIQNDPRVLFAKERSERGLASMALLPLLVADEAVGVLCLYADEPNFFDEDELRLLTELAGDIAFAIDHIDKQQRMARLNRIEVVMSNIGSLILRVEDRQDLFDEVCRIAVGHGGFAMAQVLVVDAQAQEARTAAVAGAEGAIMTTSLSTRPGEDTPEALGTTLRAIGERTLVHDNDLMARPDIGFGRLEAARRGYGSVVSMPLLVQGAVVAVITLYAREKGFFTEDELRLLERLAADVAFALDHIAKAEELNYLAYYDVLTGLANRSLFLERVTQYMHSATAGGHQLAVFLIDLERFKNINDSLGQAAGDALLKQVAEWVTRNMGDANLVARVGADHFAVVVPRIRPDGNVVRLLEKTLECFFEHPFRLNDAVFRIAAKVGVAIFPDDGWSADALLKNAEAALKKAKAGGDRYLFYTPKMTETVAARLTLENQLRRAIDNEEFVLHYQPKVSLASGKLTSAEALIRWNDPRAGLVPPGRFIPVLEETGLIHEVGRWALRKAIEDYLRWRAAGLPAVRIAVNVSPLQLRNRAFIAEVKGLIAIDAHAAAGLELELTESLIMEDVKHSIASLQAIRSMGVTVAIDDFGTGFSSLSYLAKLPVDTLKIDSSFVNDMTAAPEGLALVSTIISLAHSLKLNVVAEGVETDEQSRLLRLLNCDEMQGYLFSKPVPSEIFETRFLAPLAAGEHSGPRAA